MPLKDPEARRAYDRAYRQAHADARLAKRREYDRARYATNPEVRATQLAANYAWSRANQPAVNKLRRNYTLRIKQQVLGHYGGKCACCGETELAFLAIDHMNNDGTLMRRTGGHPRQGGEVMYRWLRRNSYPEGFQVLCHNCNLGKKINGGVCPHQQPVTD